MCTENQQTQIISWKRDSVPRPWNPFEWSRLSLHQGQQWRNWSSAPVSVLYCSGLGSQPQLGVIHIHSQSAHSLTQGLRRRQLLQCALMRSMTGKAELVDTIIQILIHVTYFTHWPLFLFYSKSLGFFLMYFFLPIRKGSGKFLCKKKPPRKRSGKFLCKRNLHVRDLENFHVKKPLRKRSGFYWSK